MTAKEKLIQKLLSMTDEQIDRFYNLMTRFNWDAKAALEYIQNGGKA